jgi:hypothetical protein
VGDDPATERHLHPDQAHLDDGASFTVTPKADSAPMDGGGGTAASAGAGDTTHPEDWAGGRSIERLREQVRAAGLDPGDRDELELVELLKQHKPSNAADPIGTSGPDARGSGA